ncbi:TonB family protein [Geitlerinema sp. PCC 7407]|nr:TonB family protein [Geitlerinema sp. PCC 7407]
MSYDAFAKALSEPLRQPGYLAFLASVSIHGLLWAVLPMLPSSSSTPDIEQRSVDIVTLTPAEQQRLPATARDLPGSSSTILPAFPNQAGLSMPNLQMPGLQSETSLADLYQNSPDTSSSTSTYTYTPDILSQLAQQEQLAIAQQEARMRELAARSAQDGQSGSVQAPGPITNRLIPNLSPSFEPPIYDPSEILKNPELIAGLGNSTPPSSGQPQPPTQPTEQATGPQQPQGETQQPEDPPAQPPADSTSDPEASPPPAPEEPAGALPNKIPDAAIAYQQEKMQEYRDRYTFVAEGTKQSEAAARTEQWDASAKAIAAKEEKNISWNRVETAVSLYPTDACYAKPEGAAAVGVLVDPEGKIVEDQLMILQSSGYKAFNDAALAHVKEMPFEGTGEYQQILLPFEFRYSEEICAQQPGATPGAPAEDQADG